MRHILGERTNACCVDWRMNDWLFEWLNGWVNEWVNEWFNERMNEWMNEWRNERTNGRTNERMNERMNTNIATWLHKRDPYSVSFQVKWMNTNIATRLYNRNPLCVWFQVIVELRVVFLKIGEIDTLKEQYSADTFIQAKWREPALDGKLLDVSKSTIPSHSHFSHSLK